MPNIFFGTKEYLVLRTLLKRTSDFGVARFNKTRLKTQERPKIRPANCPQSKPMPVY